MNLKYSGQIALSQIFTLIKSKFDSLSKVASSGSYNDLSDKPVELNFSVGSTQLETDSVTTVNIPSNITSTTNLLVYHNGLLLTESINYTKTSSSVVLVDYTASSGDIFTFISI